MFQYICEPCQIFDNVDKGQFHCQGCGLCRLGGRQNFFHCDTCEMCLPLGLQKSHNVSFSNLIYIFHSCCGAGVEKELLLKIDDFQCVVGVSRSNCPVCQEDLHTSAQPCQVPPCGHLLHQSCFQDLISNRYLLRKCWARENRIIRNWPKYNLKSSFRHFYLKSC